MKSINGVLIIMTITALVLLIIYLMGGYFVISSLIQEDSDSMLPFNNKVTSINLIENNTLIAWGPIYYPQTRTYASLGDYRDLIEKIIQCESGGIHEKWGDLDKKYPVYGVAQFQERTFYWLADLAGQELEWKNEQDQRWLLEWAIENDYGYLWTCYRILANK